MYEFVEHTGELAVRVKGKDLPSLFITAARAMSEYLMGDLPSGPPVSPEEVQVSAPDVNSLLVAWLSEILYRIEVNDRVYQDFKIRQFTDQSLAAEIIGSNIARLAKDIKAITHHGLDIKRIPDGYEAVVTFDV